MKKNWLHFVFAPVIMHSVKMNFKKALLATQQVSFTKCSSAASLPFGCYGASDTSAAPSLLPSHRLILGEVRIKFYMLSFLQDKVK